MARAPIRRNAGVIFNDLYYNKKKEISACPKRDP
jgi:hypothetical protein